MSVLRGSISFIASLFIALFCMISMSYATSGSNKEPKGYGVTIYNKTGGKKFDGKEYIKPEVKEGKKYRGKLDDTSAVNHDIQALDFEVDSKSKQQNSRKKTGRLK